MLGTIRTATTGAIAQSGPTLNAGGSAKRRPTTAAMATIAGQRGSSAAFETEVRDAMQTTLAEVAPATKLRSFNVRPAPHVDSMEMGPGDQIGQYKLETVLGEGGMGVVYRALDTKLNRPVAVKSLSNELADAPARRRFQREAQTASGLNHPHILTVFDAG